MYVYKVLKSRLLENYSNHQIITFCIKNVLLSLLKFGYKMNTNYLYYDDNAKEQSLLKHYLN